MQVIVRIQAGEYSLLKHLEENRDLERDQLQHDLVGLQLRLCKLVEAQDGEYADCGLNSVQDVDDCVACSIFLACLAECSSDDPLGDGQD